MTIIICGVFFMGFIAGWLFKGTYTPKEHNLEPVNTLTFCERQLAKVKYVSDAERIRELNLLSANQSKFYRILQHEFNQHELVVKNKRFYVIDKDFYPLSVFEYRDGLQRLRLSGVEDGLRFFMYKAILSKDAIAEDKEIILGGADE
ncbi:hypothetical protein [Acinetobacter baumannii]|uniref:hypothetical protein n=1 Tax=Acinetobacter baumannii TaxID=470 RepID=UPI0027407C39|nr:hypothetical protein [Acinetobacter baumannii]MDP7849749.1 hypothetical protein [Acinetobacter baumannii]